MAYVCLLFRLFNSFKTPLKDGQLSGCDSSSGSLGLGCLLGYKVHLMTLPLLRTGTMDNVLIGLVSALNNLNEMCLWQINHSISNSIKPLRITGITSSIHDVQLF